MDDWQEIERQHGPTVWRIAYRLLNNRADADDCYQETFVQAVQLAMSEPVRNWRALLTRLATCRALDRLRQRATESDHCGGFPEEPILDRRSIDPVQEAESEELRRLLREALSTVNDLQAQAFCLRYFEGFRCEDIADQLGITRNNVDQLLTRARGHLRRWLQAHWPGAERINREARA
jgi:RNA polymerase sigma-70 factor (ECF subfamily)